MTAARPTFEEFGAFCKGTLGFDIDDRKLQTWITTNIETARSQIQQHEFVAFAEELVAKYQVTSHRLPINIVSRDFQLFVKSYPSIISKLFRQNVLSNRRFPQPLKGGWIGPRNMFGRINDLVRSTIVCRHIDEPAKIAQEILKKTSTLGLKASARAQTKDEGYYAHHVYVSIPVSLVDEDWQQFSETLLLEIQITTEMQHMLYELTHRFYDRERNQSPKDPHSWKWDYRSARFSASYLSHTLHLLEGMILQLYEDTEDHVIGAAEPEVAAVKRDESLVIMVQAVAEVEGDQSPTSGQSGPNPAEDQQ